MARLGGPADVNDFAAIQTDVFLQKYGLVISLARRYAPDEELAKDIVQQVFVEFIGSDHRLDFVANTNSLLHRITKNIALRHWHEKQRHSSEKIRAVGEYIAQIAGENNVKEGEMEQTLEALQLCLEKLPFKSRKLIDLRYFESVPTKEIAEKYQSKPKTISRAICRIREVLKSCIEKVGKNVY